MANPGTLFSESILDAAVLVIRISSLVQTIHLASHEMLVVEIPETPVTIGAIADYLINCIAQTIALDLQIVTELVGSDSGSLASIADDVRRRIGEDNSIGDEFRQDERDPWIAEGIGHLLLNMSRQHSEIPPDGVLH